MMEVCENEDNMNEKKTGLDEAEGEKPNDTENEDLIHRNMNVNEVEKIRTPCKS